MFANTSKVKYFLNITGHPLNIKRNANAGSEI